MEQSSARLGLSLHLTSSRLMQAFTQAPPVLTYTCNATSVINHTLVHSQARERRAEEGGEDGEPGCRIKGREKGCTRGTVQQRIGFMVQLPDCMWEIMINKPGKVLGSNNVSLHVPPTSFFFYPLACLHCDAWGNAQVLRQRQQRSCGKRAS